MLRNVNFFELIGGLTEARKSLYTRLVGDAILPNQQGYYLTCQIEVNKFSRKLYCIYSNRLLRMDAR